jgi:antitoxin HicB
MSSDYEIRIRPLPPEDGGGYLAWVPDLPGCTSDGATTTEAVENVTTAIDEWLAEATRLGRSIPAPAVVHPA